MKLYSFVLLPANWLFQSQYLTGPELTGNASVKFSPVKLEPFYGVCQ